MSSTMEGMGMSRVGYTNPQSGLTVCLEIDMELNGSGVITPPTITLWDSNTRTDWVFIYTGDCVNP